MLPFGKVWSGMGVLGGAVGGTARSSRLRSLRQFQLTTAPKMFDIRTNVSNSNTIGCEPL
jgi:hypothetical protein